MWRWNAFGGGGATGVCSWPEAPAFCCWERSSVSYKKSQMDLYALKLLLQPLCFTVLPTHIEYYCSKNIYIVGSKQYQHCIAMCGFFISIYIAVSDDIM